MHLLDGTGRFSFHMLIKIIKKEAPSEMLLLHVRLSDAEAGFHQLISLAGTTDDGFLAALNLADVFAETLLCFGGRQDTALQDFAVETADEVFVGLVAVFAGNLNHIEKQCNRLR